MSESYQPNDRFRPFSNGTEFEMWLARNCQSGHRGCRKYNPNAESSRNGCPIEVALAEANCLDGTIPIKIGLRGGFLQPVEGKIVRPACFTDGKCPEYKGYDEPDDRPRRGPKPPEGQEDLLDPRNAPERTRESVRAHG